MKKAFLIATMALPIFSIALAQEAGKKQNPIQMTASTFAVQKVKEKGKMVEKLVEAKNTQPGALLEMRQTVRNITKHKYNNLVVNMPIDPSVAYQNQQCDVKNIKVAFSIDGGKSFKPAPLKKKVTVTENGKKVTKEVTVPPSEYQAIQWNIATIKDKQTINCAIRVAVR